MTIAYRHRPNTTMTTIIRMRLIVNAYLETFSFGVDRKPDKLRQRPIKLKDIARHNAILATSNTELCFSG